MKEKILNYFTEVGKEMKKVTWPTTEELKESTMVVVVTCLVVALFTWVVDFGITQLFKAIF